MIQLAWRKKREKNIIQIIMGKCNLVMDTLLRWSNFKQWFLYMTNLNLSYKALISSTLIWILICGSIVEWYAVNYSENHQSGWQFTGMIMMAIIAIPLSLLLSQISEYFKKDIGKRVYLLVTLILVPGIYLLLWSEALANWKMLESNHCLKTLCDCWISSACSIL